ncbi:MAG: Hsp20/alpha crystallin family protein [Gemmatimonadota bacterium]|nr:MAG: Hsp20/alpha crystallin family protein [Gemmatimonadota bacterium]
MALVRWDPFREMEEVADRFTRLLQRRPEAAPTRDREDITTADWVPAVDVSETDAEYLVKAELPGIKKEDVKLTVSEGRLTLRGERQHKKEEKTEKLHRVERAYGSFVRSFTLPDDVDEAKLSADYSDGVLRVHLPKSAVTKPKATEIQIK